jgi:hypothetical protein
LEADIGILEGFLTLDKLIFYFFSLLAFKIFTRWCHISIFTLFFIIIYDIFCTPPGVKKLASEQSVFHRQFGHETISNRLAMAKTGPKQNFRCLMPIWHVQSPY